MAKNTENVTEVQMSPEETKANVRMYEDDILGGLMAAAAYKTDMDEVAKIQIIRHKAVMIAIPSGSSWPQMVMIHQKSKSHAKQTAARVPQAS